jgi:hypothetical protein
VPEAVSRICDVVECHQTAVGSYLHAADTPALQFAVCHEHLARMKAGWRPTVVAEGLGPDGRGGSPALLLDRSATDDR